MTMKNLPDREAATQLRIGLKMLRRYIDEEGNWIKVPQPQNVGGDLRVGLWTKRDIERVQRQSDAARIKADKC